MSANIIVIITTWINKWFGRISKAKQMNEFESEWPKGQTNHQPKGEKKQMD